MSASNGVIRIGRKGKKKFAFGDGEPFTVDIVTAWQQWIGIDDAFRPDEEDANGNRPIPLAEIPGYQQSAVEFVRELAGDACRDEDITPAEALDFIARLKEQYDELAVFFRPKSPQERASPATSEAELRFSVEEEAGS